MTRNWIRARVVMLTAVFAACTFVWMVFSRTSIYQAPTYQDYFKTMLSNTERKAGESNARNVTSLIQSAGKFSPQVLMTDQGGNTTISASQQTKLILGYTTWVEFIPEWPLDFSKCEYKCSLTTDKTKIDEAILILFEQKELTYYLQHIPSTSAHQYKVFIDYESAAYSFNKVKPSWDGVFNISLTQRRGSTIQYSIYQNVLSEREQPVKSTNYFLGKDKDMVAYVSNCDSRGYDRIKAMNDLSKHGLSLDLFGKCGKKAKHCHIDNWKLVNCEDNSVYKFYLAYENSLCEDYITEKLWKVLASDLYMIPVVMGGKTIDDYIRVAPPNSFIHVENFTSTENLAEYLKSVASDADLFNSYHKWREQYKFDNTDGRQALPACKLCSIAHEKPDLPAIRNLSAWWNEGACRSAGMRVLVVQPILFFELCLFHIYSSITAALLSPSPYT